MPLIVSGPLTRVIPMLLLHTSDWHIGRSFHGTGLLESQRAVLDQLVDTVRERGVDAVLLAGDVFDRALPPADAVRLLDETLAAIRAAGYDLTTPMVVTSAKRIEGTQLTADTGSTVAHGEAFLSITPKEKPAAAAQS